MDVYEKCVVIKDPKNLVLSDLPFQPGQCVKVTLVPDKGDQVKRVREIKVLFSATQELPQVKAITDEEIAAEIAAYRASKL